MPIGNNIRNVIEDQAKKRKRQSLPLEKNKSKINQTDGKLDQPNMRYTQSQPSINIDTGNVSVRHLKFTFIFSKTKIILNIYISVFRDHLIVFQLNKRKVSSQLNLTNTVQLNEVIFFLIFFKKSTS